LSFPEIIDVQNTVLLSPSSIMVRWRSGKNTGFNYASELKYCRLDVTTLTSRMTLYPMVGEPEEMLESLNSDAYWTDCTILDAGRQSSKTFSGLPPRTTYKFQVRHTSSFGNTAWSDDQIFMTSLEYDKEIYKRVRLFARGTSATNHDQAVVKVDNNVILEKGNYKGLYMVAFSR
jgi:hypothetical protein